MHVYGLTGGMGMGKSTAGLLLRKRGIPVIDTDVVAREIVEPGRPALARVREAFGPEVIDSTGALRREFLARRVFAEPAARKLLESILHPEIRRRWKAQMAGWRDEGRSCAVVIIPLLFENGAEKEVDATICVACSGRTQQARLADRGWNDEEIRRRNEAQWPVDRKLAAADFVVWSEGTLEVHEHQLERILRLTLGWGENPIGAHRPPV